VASQHLLDVKQVETMWIGFSKKIDKTHIKNLVTNLYPEFFVAVLDDLADFPEEKESWPEVVATLDENESEFPLVLRLVWWPKNEMAPNSVKLSKLWGKKFGCNTIVDSSDYGDDDSPFWCVTFRENDYYLADDCESKFSDEPGGKEVNVVRKIQI
jgi:hypothetical protein